MVKLNKIYTRTGDDGTTGLVDGSRLPKHAARMEAIGAVDEANAALGFALRKLNGAPADSVFRIQNDLFDLGADLATPAEDDDFTPSDMVLRIVPSQVAWLENGSTRSPQCLRRSPALSSPAEQRRPRGCIWRAPRRAVPNAR
jgi:cob(I)alamin adenosyltransferase